VIHAARQHVASIDRFIDRRTFTRNQFVQFLESLGFRGGATVMVHSSMRAIRRRAPHLSAEALIRLLQDLVRSDGTLLMPTFPFSGKEADYANTHTRFSVRHTPSKTGALTEVFRAMPDVIRSFHPTHPVAAWGRHALDLVARHHEGSTFGIQSPFYRMKEYEGLVIGLGTRLRNAFTILHVAEDLNPVSRELAFDERPRVMMVDDGVAEIPCELRIMRPGVEREYRRVERILLDEGILRYVRTRGLQCAVTSARAFIERTLKLADENAYLLRQKKS
jgi:aminoglycoside 3-N-acetyltransferase